MKITQNQRKETESMIFEGEGPAGDAEKRKDDGGERIVDLWLCYRILWCWRKWWYGRENSDGVEVDEAVKRTSSHVEENGERISDCREVEETETGWEEAERASSHVAEADDTSSLYYCFSNMRRGTLCFLSSSLCLLYFSTITAPFTIFFNMRTSCLLLLLLHTIRVFSSISSNIRVSCKPTLVNLLLEDQWFFD